MLIDKLIEERTVVGAPHFVPIHDARSPAEPLALITTGVMNAARVGKRFA